MGGTFASMITPYSFWSALDTGRRRGLVRGPAILGPRPDQSGAHPPPLTDIVEMPTYAGPVQLPGGIRTPQLPTSPPDIPPPSAPEEPDEMDMGQKMLRALGETVRRGARMNRDNQPFFVRQRTE